MIKCSAPGRCGIIGNPTDMYGGSVISCSTSERAHCTISDADKLTIYVSGYQSEVKCTEDLALDQSKLDLPRVVLQYFNLTPETFPCRISADTDVPEQAGLAGSTALMVAIVGAVMTKLKIDTDPYLVAETAKRIEYKNMGIICGYQDQYMASFGGLNYMDFAGKEMMEQAEDEPYATVEPLGHIASELPILLAHTGVVRNSGTVHRSLRDRWSEGDRAVLDGLSSITSLARLGKKAIINGDWHTLAELMNENHSIIRNLGGSGPSNETLISAALQHGALGAKLAGAGKGGTIIALTLDPAATAEGLKKAGADRIMWPRPTEGLAVKSMSAK